MALGACDLHGQRGVARRDANQLCEEAAVSTSAAGCQVVFLEDIICNQRGVCGNNKHR